MEESTHQRLARLTDAWKIAKQQEEAFKETRITIESEIYELKRAEIPEKGVLTLDTGMKIATGFTEDWDQSALATAYQQWPVESVKFPFTSVYKAEGKAIGVIRESIPDLYRLIQPALTLKPKKPAFSVKE